MLEVNLADDKLYFLYYFYKKIGLDILCELSQEKNPIRRESPIFWDILKCLLIFYFGFKPLTKIEELSRRNI